MPEMNKTSLRCLFAAGALALFLGVCWVSFEFPAGVLAGPARMQNEG